MSSQQPATATPDRVAAPTLTDPVSRARVTIVSTALALGSAASIAVLLWRPGPARDDLSYASFAATRDAAWAGYLIDALGYAVASFALAIAVCLLVRERGAVLANVGAVLTIIGGFLFAAAAYVFAVFGWYATATDAIPAEQGTALMAYLEDNLAHLVGPQVIGFMMFNVGTLLLAGALWRSQAVPRWLPIAVAVLTIAQFGPLPGRLLDVEQALHLASFIAVAWYTRARLVTRLITARG